MKYLISLITLFFIFSEIHAETIPQDSISAQKKEVRYDSDGKVNPIEFNTTEIESYKKDSAFDYTEKVVEENWWTSFTKWVKDVWNRFWHWVFGDYEDNGIIAFFIGILPYLIIIGLIFFIAWLFYKLNPGARLLKSKEAPEMFFTEEEEIIKSKDIQVLINKALDKKDFRLAVRYYYLLLLKNLTDVNLIEYEFDKTNNDYLKEITSKAINQNFEKATLLYDYIWYGNFSVSENDFYKAQQVFKNIDLQIKETHG
ncbi:MAG: hypothetical protein ACI9SJ_000891 [Flavobacteriaceae bacterium]|jgi:hypothetical protein|uniref:DUF4129 domain-containing protein n=1 Tax=Candidatus Marifrigoribacter sp. Uisw_064 TaxID=3230970 RepID=UPI003AE4114A